ITDIPTPIACDYPDESAYSSSSTIHQLDGAGGDLTGLMIGSSVDFEATGLGTVTDTTGDDITDTGASDDEDGVVFSLVPGDNSSMTATVSYTNPTAGSVTLCGWLDINDSGSYEMTEGICNLVGSSGSVELTWTGLSAVSAYTVYARFRITSGTLTTASASGTIATDGETEAYKIDVDPTAVTIGQVELTETRVSDFLVGLKVEQMDIAALYALLQAWDAEQAANLAGADRQTMIDALQRYLDPDKDGQLAVLYWDTLEERGTIGFYVKRKQDDQGWIQLNKLMLPGLITAPMGGEYQLADPSAQSGHRYQYQLIEQEARGTTRTYGPFELQMGQ
ncbi:MAG: hypothetical protein GY697_26135, partial [Desulfobacterales bacterium]|nr:hypothetical protein [Desulfobacterales bacterium]